MPGSSCKIARGCHHSQNQSSSHPSPSPHLGNRYEHENSLKAKLHLRLDSKFSDVLKYQNKAPDDENEDEDRPVFGLVL